MHNPFCCAQLGLSFAFFSAFSVIEEHKVLRAEAADAGIDLWDLRAERSEAKEREKRRKVGSTGRQGGKEGLQGFDLAGILTLQGRRVRGVGHWVASWSVQA